MPDLPKLNLPDAKLPLRQIDGEVQVYCALRRKWLVLTPEEWVRQHFVHMLLANGYSANRMANEVSLKLNGTLRRCDTVVYDRFMRPVMIIEYKAPHILLTQKTIDQIARYNMVLDALYLVVSNGLNHFCCRVDGNGGYAFTGQLPAAAELETSRP